MAVWYMVVLYLTVFALLQFVVYRYLRGRDEGTASTPGTASSPETGGFDEQRPRGRPEDPDGDGGVRRCPHCGAANEGEQTFTYCRNCAGQLGR